MIHWIFLRSLRYQFLIQTEIFWFCIDFLCDLICVEDLWSPVGSSEHLRWVLWSLMRMVNTPSKAFRTNKLHRNDADILNFNVKSNEILWMNARNYFFLKLFRIDRNSLKCLKRWKPLNYFEVKLGTVVTFLP